MSVREMSLTHDGVEALALELRPRALGRALAVLGREADERLIGAPACGDGGEHVLGRLELERQPVAPRSSILSPSVAAGRKSATAAAIRSTSARGEGSRTAASSSAAVSTVTVSTPAGDGSDTFAATRVTSAPRRAASSASARPIRPDERLPTIAHRVDRLARAAGGHEHAQAVERTRRVNSTRSAALDRGQDLGRVGQPPHAPLALRGEPAGPRLHDPRRRASAASRGWPAWPGARTCGCSSPAPAPAARRRPARRS